MGTLNSRATAITVAAVVTLCAALPTLTSRQPATAAPEPTATASSCAEPAAATALRTALGPVLRDEIAGYEHADRQSAVDLAMAERALARVRADPQRTASDAGIAKADVRQATRMAALVEAAQEAADADLGQLPQCGLVAQRRLTIGAADRATAFQLDGLRASRAQWRAHLRWDRASRAEHLGQDDAAWDEAVADDRSVLAGIDDSIAALLR